MTSLPQTTAKKLGLAIDLDTCDGCQACVTACKGWNDQGYGAPLSDQDPYGANPSGTFLNRVHSYAVQSDPAAVLAASPKPPLVTFAEHGARFVAAVENGPLQATQFHPEKSGDAGAQMLKNWLGTL